MPAPRSNILLPIVAGVVVLGASVLFFMGAGPGGDDGRLTKAPRGSGPDADSPAETLRTVGAQMEAMRKQLREQRADNAKLLRQKQDIEANMDRRIEERLAQLPRPLPDTGTGTAMDAMMTEIDQLRGDVIALRDAPPAYAPASSSLLPNYTPVQTSTVVWTRPLGMEVAAGSSGGGGLLNGSLPPPGGVGGSPPGAVNAVRAPDPLDTPVFTIPDNATLVGSTAMTALVGRIPIKGRVNDPYPFKVIIGQENLAANGLEIPGVVNMIFSGTAVGDWNLSCVSGRVTSATFVFEDGTIRTIESTANNSSNSGSGQGGLRSTDRKALGWISDNSGVPCVTGEKITNAPSYLAGRTLVATVAAVAEAAAAAQTTSFASPIGGTSSTIVNGDTGKFILGRGLGDGMAEITKWMDDRQSQSFDAVFVAPGATVAVHIEQELRIDYEHRGRKLAYANNLFRQGRTGGLD